ncbi:hypothetical protein PQR05_00605 [Paraburkholderia sediminicola]|uniref:hypothetical protein n=1 Tax=Paraburkholderia sediminicola TaxID=458836 RepID=UPI0038BAE209
MTALHYGLMVAGASSGGPHKEGRSPFDGTLLATVQTADSAAVGHALEMAAIFIRDYGTAMRAFCSFDASAIVINGHTPSGRTGCRLQGFACRVSALAAYLIRSATWKWKRCLSHQPPKAPERVRSARFGERAGHAGTV